MTAIHHTHLTCSLIRVVSPISLSSSHFPKKSSPKKGLRGFFSLPSFSLRLQYCWWSVVRNHFRTKSALFAGSGSVAGAMKIAGCSAQYAEYSTSDVEERMKGGAVREDRSPLKDAMDYGGGVSNLVINNYTAEHQSCLTLQGMHIAGEDLTLRKVDQEPLLLGGRSGHASLLETSLEEVIV